MNNLGSLFCPGMNVILVTFALGKQNTPFEQNSTYPVLFIQCAEQPQSFFFFSLFLYFLLSSAFTLQFQKVRTEKEELETQLLSRAGTK